VLLVGVIEAALEDLVREEKVSGVVGVVTFELEAASEGPGLGVTAQCNKY
jgi:hypothetical protein